MMKTFFKISIVATLFMFVACSSDDSGSCDEAALMTAYEAAYDKYDEDPTDANCQAVVRVIKEALTNNCISKEDADDYGSGLPCYSSGGNTDVPAGGDECDSLRASATAALSAYNSNSNEANCQNAVDAIYNAFDEGCLSMAEAKGMAEDLPCFDINDYL